VQLWQLNIAAAVLALLAGGLCALFMSRIMLKDFRDRAGDAAYGKPTFLLRFGKGVTCAASAAALAVGAMLVIAAIGPSPVVLCTVVTFTVAIAAQLWALHGTDDLRLEQVAIGLGARLGNGLLVCILAWLLLSGQEAPPALRAVVVLLVAASYLGSYAALAKAPEDVVIGYKG
jgi:hypothetical protein